MQRKLSESSKQMVRRSSFQDAPDMASVLGGVDTHTVYMKLGWIQMNLPLKTLVYVKSQ